MRAVLPALGAAAGMVLLAMALGFVVASRIRLDNASIGSPAPSNSAVGAVPTPQPTRRPTAPPTALPSPAPSPTPSPTPGLVVPSLGPAGPDGISPPLPALDIEGADPTVVAAIHASVKRLATLRAYRFIAGTSGRSIVDLSRDAGLNAALRGDLTRASSRSLDALFTFQMVEASGDAATSSTSRIVIIGKRAWEVRAGQPPKPIPAASRPQTLAFIEVLLPAGVAERTVVPFAGGYERVGAEPHGGVATIHYRATPAGLDAYAAVTGIEGTWTAELWIAVGDGHLVSALVRGREAYGNGGFLAQIDLTHANDRAIVIKVPR